MSININRNYKFDGDRMETSGDFISIIAISIGIAILLFIAWIFLRKRKPYDYEDDMDGAQFESYCASILQKNGFEDIKITPQSRDFGIDILAKKEDITYAIQCKYYSEPVGIKAVQEAYAGKDYYDAMVGVVMTNQDFTKTGLEFAEKLRVIMWNGDDIYKMSRNIK